MLWKKININIQNIKVDNGRAVLINCPHNSAYNGWSFWHPGKLIRKGRHSFAVELSYNDGFKFKLVKYGKGKWNSRNILAEKEIDVEEFEEMFGVMDENIVAPKEDNESYLKIEEPEKVDLNVEIKEELKNE